MTLQELQELAQQGESDRLEFKRSSAQFPRAGESLCAFMNGTGGHALVGVAPDGTIVGQEVADKTFQDLAQVLRRLDPPIPYQVERVRLNGTDAREILVLGAVPSPLPARGMAKLAEATLFPGRR
jgi:ATP-dependent DNA helicase RecG